MHARLDARSATPEPPRAALTPRRSRDPYLRAMKRRRTPGGRSVRDGSEFQAVPIELMAVATQPNERSAISLLRRFVAEMEDEPYRDATLRGFVARRSGSLRRAPQGRRTRRRWTSGARLRQPGPR
jgi:hypothetical protein